MRKNLVIAGLVLALVSSMALSVVALDSAPASKASAQVASFNILSAAGQSAASSGWVPIFTTSIKTSNQKDLFVDVSLQSGLYTKTTVRSKDMKSDTSTASAGVKVRVLVDGQEALPGTITYNARTQELSATLQGQLDLIDRNGNGVIEPGELESVAYEEISLLLNTISANAFNFVHPDVPSGVHQVVVEAKVDIDSGAQNGSAESKAVIGAGSVTVEEVRMVRGNNVELAP